MNVLEISDTYHKTASDLLKSSLLVEVLEKYGRIEYEGAYAGNVMFDGDIDIKVIKENEFSVDEMFTILRDLHDTCADSFRSYFLKRDWDDPRIGKQFPYGQYLGLKTHIGNEKWKCDIWFISESEAGRDRNKLDISKISLSPQQRALILKFKKYRKQNNLKVSGQSIYEAILENGMTQPEELSVQTE